LLSPYLLLLLLLLLLLPRVAVVAEEEEKEKGEGEGGEMSVRRFEDCGSEREAQQPVMNKGWGVRSCGDV
jgi:hypothetical protein